MGFYSKTILPRILDRTMNMPAINELRAAALQAARGRVLEIGFGTGLNLPHYGPAVTRLVTVDPNPGMQRLALKKVARHSFPVEHHTLSGERLPFDDNSFDTVVSTFTLCSIGEAGRALNEIKRVLKPEGRFIFLEHGLSDEPGVRKWQHRLNPLQKKLVDGCHLNRDIAALIEQAGFKLLNLKKFYGGFGPKVADYIYQGQAARSESPA